MPDNIPPSDTKDQASPPPYTLPKFTTGQRSTDLLVQPQQLKGHLSILHAFHNLRLTIQSDHIPQLPNEVCAMEPGKRWAWFVNIAVERFDRWCRSLGSWCSANLELALPPIDVLMVWHAHLLNPIWYAEDTGRTLALAHLPDLSECIAAHIGSPDLLITNSPHPDRVHNWEAHTETPYDPWDAAAILSHKEIKCPYCEQRMAVAFLGPDAAGYAQSNFTSSCTSCEKTIKKNLLGLYKFANDIVKTADFLPGTLYTPQNPRDTQRATLIKKRVMAAARLPSSDTLTVENVMKKLNFSPEHLTKILSEQVRRRIGRRIMSAYTDDRPFSIELVGAVLRQGSFVGKMADLGWTEPDCFGGEEEMVVLQHCVARYHAFLELMADSPGSFFVPTLDIDLAWHTHQLTAKSYHTDCKRVVGRYIDHEDKVDENHLATGFDDTALAWMGRYNHPYSYCGCALPGKTLGQRLRHALSIYRHRTANAQNALQPPPEGTGATHPSDHNAVYLMHNAKAADQARARRRAKAEQRQNQEGRDAQVEDDEQKQTHEPAFLYPVPLWNGAASCVADASVVVDGKCATGVGGCMAACGGAACVSVAASQHSGGSGVRGGGSTAPARARVQVPRGKTSARGGGSRAQPSRNIASARAPMVWMYGGGGGCGGGGGGGGGCGGGGGGGGGC